MTGDLFLFLFQGSFSILLGGNYNNRDDYDTFWYDIKTGLCSSRLILRMIYRTIDSMKRKINRTTLTLLEIYLFMMALGLIYFLLKS